MHSLRTIIKYSQLELHEMLMCVDVDVDRKKLVLGKHITDLV